MAQQPKKSTDLQTIDSTIREWAPALKDFALTEFNHNQFFRSAILAISESDSLMECMTTAPGRESLKNAMKRAFSTGLSLNPQEGKAAIIAYKGKASYQIMKEGAIDIVMRSGDAKKLIVEVVYEKDEFTIEKSPAGDSYFFRPARRARGKVDGFFCWILDRDDTQHVKYMTQDECFEIRDASSIAWKFSGDKSNWGKFPIGMSKKTVIKAAIRDLYISPESKSMFSAEEQSWDKPPVKDITPERPAISGQSADAVAAKLDKKAAPEPEPTPPAETVPPNKEPIGGQTPPDKTPSRF